MSLAITPDTKIGALLEAYPAVEEALVSLAPAFKKLRNPVLRKTVAKLATLEQAAQIGGVSLREMMTAVRAAAGQPEGEAPAETAETRGSAMPALRVVEEVDADAMLERGVHPVGRIRQAAAALGQGEAVLLRSSFKPVPLIETMRRAGAEVYSATDGAVHLTYFGPTRSGSAAPLCHSA